MSTNSNTCIVNPIVVENLDGTVSVFNRKTTNGPSIPIVLSQFCCLALNPDYIFDVETQKCLWSNKQTCDIQNVFKIVLNPKGNDGSIFNLPNNFNDTCVLDIEFDYLFKIKCETLYDMMIGKPLNPEIIKLENQKNGLILQIEQQSVNCERLSNEINLLKIYLNDIPKEPQNEALITQVENDILKKSLELINCRSVLENLNTQLTELNLLIENKTLSCSKPIDFFESLDVSMTVDIVSNNKLETVFEDNNLHPEIGSGNLYQYLLNNNPSGFYVCDGDPCVPLSLNLTGVPNKNASKCELILNDLVNSLYDESGLNTNNNSNTLSAEFTNSLPSGVFSSDWIHFKTSITDPDIIQKIDNKKIKISLKINHTCSDICILLDNIELNKSCTYLKQTNIFVSNSPGFKIEKIRDNKKSWVKNDSLINRDFKLTNYAGSNAIRQTNYNVEDERLIFNSKDIDLDISLASAIETDVWSYVADNPCILTGVTNCNPCPDCLYKSFQDGECFEFMDNNPYMFMDGIFTGSTYLSKCCGDNYLDFNSLLTQPLSAVTILEDFQYHLTSELIDAKNRQTISGYPTLRALYDRYLNSLNFCGDKSSSFDYLTINQFANLVGNYWVDIIEQVIPSTTIWGSVKIYSNTIFDQQKYRYKSYSTLLCTNPFYGTSVSSPINKNSGETQNVNVVMTTINLPTSGSTYNSISTPIVCDKIWVAQMNSGSEFVGTVSFTNSTVCNNIDEPILSECTLQVNVNIDNLTASIDLIGAATPVIIEWSTGGSEKSKTFNTNGNYSVTVTDANCCSITTEFTI